jgi:TRAP-type mannitol/chloroaromatic compound transport system substrate-binding protein
MKRKNVLKLIVGICLVAVLSIALPLPGGCTPQPTTPTEPTAPTEPTTPSEPAEEQPTFQWRFQSYADASLTEVIFTPFIANLEEASGGRMQVDIYLGDELVPISEEAIALQEGTLDIVCVSDDWGGFPADVAVFSDYFPFGVQTGIELDTLFKQRGLDEIWREAYDEVPGITWLGSGSWDPCNIISNRPVESYEDMSGLRLHTFELAARMLQPAGVIGQTLPWEDVAMAIETGMLDGLAWCGITEGHTVGWVDVCDYFLAQPISGGWMGAWFASTESWEALPPDLQELWLMAIDQMNYHRTVWYYWGEAYLSAHGDFIITTMPAEDWARVQALKEPLYEEIAAISPRCAEVIRIIREHQTDSTAARSPYPSYE